MNQATKMTYIREENPANYKRLPLTIVKTAAQRINTEFVALHKAAASRYTASKSLLISFDYNIDKSADIIYI